MRTILAGISIVGALGSLSCQTMTPVSMTSIAREYKDQVEAAWMKVYETCNRTGVAFETQEPVSKLFTSVIEFAEQPACQANLKNAMESSAFLWMGPRCMMKSNPAESTISVSCYSSTAGLWEKYRRVGVGDKKALLDACSLVAKNKNTDDAPMFSIMLGNTPTCLGMVKRAFLEDWAGLVKQRCGFQAREKAIQIHCTEELPEELEAFVQVVPDNTQQKPVVAQDKAPEKEDRDVMGSEVRAAWNKVYESCHRSKTQMERHESSKQMYWSFISFVKEPACQSSVEEAINHMASILAGPECTVHESGNDSVFGVVCLTQHSGLFAKYRHPSKGDKKALAEACTLDVSKGIELDNPTNRWITVKRTPGCLEMVEQAFTKDWKGLVQNRCAYHDRDDDILVVCTEGNQLPDELSELIVAKRLDEAYFTALQEGCSSVEFLSSKTAYFTEKKGCLWLLQHATRHVTDMKNCSVEDSNPLALRCSAGIPSGLVQWVTDHTPAKAASPPETSSLSVCKKVGGFYKNEMHFLSEEACKRELIHHIDDNPNFQTKGCYFGNHYPYGRIELTCQNHLPDFFLVQRNDKTIDELYEAGIKDVCPVTKYLSNKEVLFDRTENCSNIIIEALADRWHVFKRADCIEPSRDISGPDLRLYCYNGLPAFIYRLPRYKAPALK